MATTLILILFTAIGCAFWFNKYPFAATVITESINDSARWLSEVIKAKLLRKKTCNKTLNVESENDNKR